MRFIILSLLPLAWGLYSAKDPVQLLSPTNFKSQVMESMHPVMVEFFAPWCGHCQNLAPEYKKAASKLAGMARVVAVDCDKEENKGLCAQFGIKGFPTIKIFPGGSKGLPEDYQGPRTASAMVDFVIKKVKSFVKKLDTTSWDSFLTDKSAQVVLLSPKNDPPVMFKALSAEFYGRLDFGFIKSSEKALVEKLKVETFPTILVFPLDKTLDPVVYSGMMPIADTSGAPKLAKIKEFLEMFAKPSSKKSSTTKQPKETPKAPVKEPFDPAIPELVSQKDLNSLCLSKSGVCVIAFVNLEPEYPESVSDHKSNLDVLSLVKKKFYDLDSPFHFVWVNHIEHGRRLSKDFDVSDILPALLAVNGNKKVYRLLRSAFDEPSISSFLSDMMAGRGRNFQYTFDPLLDPPPKKPKEEPVAREDL